MIPLLAVIYQMSLSVKSLNLMLTVDSEIPPIDRNHMAKCLYKKATFSMCILSEVSKLFWMILKSRNLNPGKTFDVLFKFSHATNFLFLTIKQNAYSIELSYRIFLVFFPFSFDLLLLLLGYEKRLLQSIYDTNK